MATPKLQHLFASDVNVKDFNKAINLLDKREFDRAINLFTKVLRTQEFKEAWLNLGVAYKGKNQLGKVKDCFLKAIDPSMPFSDGTFKDSWPLAISNLGLMYFAGEQDELAEVCYKKALEADPLYYDAIWNLSLVKLRQYCSDKYSDLDKAWTYYSYRFQRENATPLKNKKTGLQMWDFKSSGDSIVVLIEQGMGDAIMFGRYLVYLEKYFKDIYVQCTPDMEYLFSNYKVCRDAIDTPAMVGVPMCSLGKLLDKIPSELWLADKYIPKERGDTLEILCIWSGTTEHVNAYNRNVPAGMFDRFKKYGNLHSVEKRTGYTRMPIVDWESTIKYLEKIDLVITIDSSVAHLCGSLGKPCLVLMPLSDTDFRWGDSSMGYSNKWYASVKVIRNPNNWAKVFESVEKCLQNI